MRKTIVTALVTLLVMLAVSCDIGSVAEKAEYTEDGERLVTLKVNIGGTVGNSRSLSNAFARDDADFVEVIFRREIATTGTYNYYRAVGYNGESLSIKVPKIDYDVTEAVVFIGKKTDAGYTLLAIGALENPLNLKTDTSISSIIFKVSSSLIANLSATAASPAFKITDDTVFWGGSDDGISKEAKKGKLPSFQIPIQSALIGASLTIGGFPTGLDFTSTGPQATISLLTNSATTITATPDSPTPVTFSSDCKFSFKINTNSATGGYYKITFSIPVAFGTDTGLGWAIHGGTISGFDASGTTKADGVLLLVSATPYEDDEVELPIEGPITLPDD